MNRHQWANGKPKEKTRYYRGDDLRLLTVVSEALLGRTDVLWVGKKGKVEVGEIADSLGIHPVSLVIIQNRWQDKGFWKRTESWKYGYCVSRDKMMVELGNLKK